ncbi:unnamed protein product [Acanthoscelides obtectus]|uniref:Lipase domain-containing protein n=1 Tax=Acanthoscelides obtectus TaxID=200917 RepID=A0A9P0PRU1_ACAOB|nr:unnamed protein product [Acanthoscelides obtectus]CAK1624517.1 Lipase member I [Acanthoscelides obtectus]
MWKKTVILFFVYDVFRGVLPHRWAIGDCPLYYDEPCDTTKVNFHLSRSARFGKCTTKIDPFKPNLPQGYNHLVPLKIVIHGYGGLGIDTATTNVSKAYEDEGYNVIIVDWAPLGMLPCYPTAVINTWHVGQCVAVLAVSLVPLGISPTLVHVIGFSLGAHIAGFAGSHLNNVLGYSFGRITGLDPALPLFAKSSNDWKLDSSDAAFVDIIHTSSGTFGKIEATGHLDFYVNGGSLQPFCTKRPSIWLLEKACGHLLFNFEYHITTYP